MPYKTVSTAEKQSAEYSIAPYPFARASVSKMYVPPKKKIVSVNARIAPCASPYRLFLHNAVSVLHVNMQTHYLGRYRCKYTKTFGFSC